MVYQMISIKVKQDRIKFYNDKREEYALLIKEGKETIEQRTMREWIEREAKKLDYYHSGS